MKDVSDSVEQAVCDRATMKRGRKGGGKRQTGCIFESSSGSGPGRERPRQSLLCAPRPPRLGRAARRSFPRRHAGTAASPRAGACHGRGGGARKRRHPLCSFRRGTRVVPALGRATAPTPRPPRRAALPTRVEAARRSRSRGGAGVAARETVAGAGPREQQATSLYQSSLSERAPAAPVPPAPPGPLIPRTVWRARAMAMVVVEAGGANEVKKSERRVCWRKAAAFFLFVFSALLPTPVNPPRLGAR